MTFEDSFMSLQDGYTMMFKGLLKSLTLKQSLQVALTSTFHSRCPKVQINRDPDKNIEFLQQTNSKHSEENGNGVLVHSSSVGLHSDRHQMGLIAIVANELEQCCSVC